FDQELFERQLELAARGVALLRALVCFTENTAQEGQAAAPVGAEVAFLRGLQYRQGLAGASLPDQRIAIPGQCQTDNVLILYPGILRQQFERRLEHRQRPFAFASAVESPGPGRDCVPVTPVVLAIGS